MLPPCVDLPTPAVPADGQPPFRQIAAQLRGEITAGRYRPGDRLPTTAQMAAHFGCATATAGSAVRILREESLISSVPGRGTFVRSPGAPEQATETAWAAAHRYRRYVQLADDLRSEIQDGRLTPGQRLPSVRSLMARYGVSSVTMQRALTHLRSEHLIHSVQGVGCFVGAAPSPTAPPESPGDLLALGERIAALEAQLAAAGLVPITGSARV